MKYSPIEISSKYVFHPQNSVWKEIYEDADESNLWEKRLRREGVSRGRRYEVPLLAPLCILDTDYV